MRSEPPKSPWSARCTRVTVGAILLCLAASVARGQQTTEPQTSSTWVGVAAPSQFAAVGTEEDGVLHSVAVVEGQRVSAGDLLFRLEDSVLVARVTQLRLRAESDVKVRDAQERLAQAEREVERWRELRRRDAASRAEAELAELAYTIAQLGVDEAILERDLALAELRVSLSRLERRTVRSPFSGTVQTLLKKEGEPVQGLNPVVELVATDPLWVEFDCPVTVAEELPLGSGVTVRRAHAPGDRSGRVVMAAVRVDPASQTRRVRVELPNPDGDWYPGTKMRVRLAPSISATPPEPAPAPANSKEE